MADKLDPGGVIRNVVNQEGIIEARTMVGGMRAVFFFLVAAGRDSETSRPGTPT